MNTTKTGLTVDVYEHGTNCSAGGLSTKYKSFVLVGASGPFEPSKKFPAVKIIKRGIGAETYVHAIPDLSDPSNEDELKRIGSANPHFMAGGTFLYSCDSRFAEFVGHHNPIAFHDRVEGLINKKNVVN
jgi:hypothetical protein